MNTFIRFILNISALLSFLGLTSCATRAPLTPFQTPLEAQDELATRVASSPELAVLFIGNSYSFGIPKAFTQAAAARGKSVRTGHATYGGWTLAQHANNDATFNKIRRGNWDLVVIQEQSEVPAMSVKQRANRMFSPLRSLVTEARKHGAIPLLYQTWGRKAGDKTRKHDDFFAMNQRLREGYLAAARDAGGLVVLPVGDAWEREFRAGRAEALYLEDGSHPTSAGNQVTAEAMAATIFGK